MSLMYGIVAFSTVATMFCLSENDSSAYFGSTRMHVDA